MGKSMGTDELSDLCFAASHFACALARIQYEAMCACGEIRARIWRRSLLLKILFEPNPKT